VKVVGILKAAQEAAQNAYKLEKRRPPKRSLALPDLEQTKSAVLNRLT
jgi:hypothetical protein